MRRKILWLIGIAVILIIAFNYSIIRYGIGQLKGQIHVLWNTEDIETFLEDDQYPDSLKRKIMLIQEAKEFAVNDLGLNTSDSYEAMFDQKGKAILWVVGATPEFSLEPFKWDYPFLGELEYKGYFDSIKAVQESNRLKKEDYDVSVNEVEAWSTLGFFDDPILSNMLEKEDGMLARLIIHELTHGTVYVESDAELNENLATFIGNKGAYLFLEKKYGAMSEEYLEYTEHMRDIDLFVKTALEMRDVLAAMYEGMSDSTSIEEKRANKKLMFRFALDRFKRLPLSKPDRFRILEQDTVQANNTFFSGLNTYRSQQDSLEQVLEDNYNGDLRLFIEGMKEMFR